MNRVLAREVAQAVMVPTTLVSRSGVRDVGKELPRVEFSLSMLFGASKPKTRLETFQHAYVPGIPQGQPLYRGAFHSFLIFHKKVGPNSRTMPRIRTLRIHVGYFLYHEYTDSIPKCGYISRLF